MIRAVEEIEGAVAHLVIAEVLPLDRLVAVPDDKDSPAGLGTEYVVDDARLGESAEVELVKYLRHMSSPWPDHSPPRR